MYLVTDKQLRANRNGNPYLLLELRDRTGGISGRMWNAGDNVVRRFDPGDFVHATGKVQLFQGALQVILTHVERVEAQKVEFADFLPQTEQSIPKLIERLRGVPAAARQPAPAGAGRMLPDGRRVHARRSPPARPA